MSQCSLERADKGRWESFAARLQHAQVRKKIGLGAGFFRTSLTVYLRLTLKQGTYIYKNVKDLIFALSYFVAVHGAILAPFGDQPHGMLRIHVEAQHQLAEVI